MPNLFTMKNTSLTSIPGYKYHEYLVVLAPNQDLQEKIMKVKKEFSEEYKSPNAVYSKPFISIVNFVQLELMEDRVLFQLKRIADDYSPFPVKLKDFGSFPTHSIFINVESKKQVQNLTQQLKRLQHFMTLNKDNKSHFIDEPNVTVAMKLLPWQYEQAWLAYSKRTFTGFFIADQMLLLRRSLEVQSDGRHVKGKYQLIQPFKFFNMHSDSTQAPLFF
jgi:2'-5' RNA ligase